MSAVRVRFGETVPKPVASVIPDFRLGPQESPDA